ncbi:ribbon-helix-helix domain-containing protein [Cohaesibacter haloalkalitolerans]|uniref:ribbon-helix-helix domain-containing protein n=1 Tax=Cohaesibacter haloalkalitolerans TaxID=1162980 RepID=UPI000E656D7D|nr:ribbon-helix-helix domain-containing protein [Cohaesibacter haloalkalitolerans]
MEPKELVNQDPASTPKFRAIRTKNGRRGIRLEQAFWLTLDMISKQRKIPLHQLVEEAEDSVEDSKNLTSTLRVLCMNWTLDQVHLSQTSTSDRVIRNLLFACPTPAFTLFKDRRIHAFNQPFLTFISRAFDMLDLRQVASNLQLLLDRRIEKLVEELKLGGNSPVNVGMTLSINNRRVKGRINAIVMPKDEGLVLVCYLLPRGELKF